MTWRTDVRILFVSFLLVAAVTACAADLQPDPPGGGDPDGGSAQSHITHTDNGDGSTTTQVDATRDAEWVHLDLETKTEVTAADPAWDLAFQRFKIKIDGGVSGAGGMEVAVLPAADFGAMAVAPADGYITDDPDGDDEGSEPELAFLRGDGWYSYDPATHVLAPRDRVHVVRSVEGGYFKLEMTNYYDGAGTSGFPTFRWAPVASPADSGVLVVDATDTQAWVYVDVEGGVVTVSDPTTSDDWDLAFSRTKIRTNSGTSGLALGGSRLAPDGATFEATSAASTIGYTRDAMLPIPGPPGSGEYSGNAVLNAWYDYNPSTHVVTSKRLVYLIRTATGDYAKLQVTDYASGLLTLRLAPVERDVTVQTTIVTATDSASWVYVDLRADAQITIADPAASYAWDLALSRTRLATNSGTSGGGGGGAAATTATALSAVTTSAGDHAVDSMLPIPGPPGSGEYSGNPVLAGWYNYDPVTHVVSPKDTVFLVRTADGGHVKLEITGYAGGSYTIDWAYAGAGRTDF
jgi:hypothetical protein